MKKKNDQMILFETTPNEFGNFIPVNLEKIGNEKLNTVNARELWEFLQSKRQFSNWIQERISKYNFENNVDFISFNKIVKRQEGATTQKEYILTLDMAKELAMIEANSQGKKIRRYFIQVEKKYWENIRGDFAKWLDKRQDGIKTRKELTDWIKEFVEYALKQDNTNGNVYYAFITASINKALFKCPSAKKLKKNLRDLLGYKQLVILETAEIIASKEIEDGMDNGLLCSKVYKNICEKINIYAGLTGSSIPELMHYNDFKQIEYKKG